MRLFSRSPPTDYMRLYGFQFIISLSDLRADMSVARTRDLDAPSARLWLGSANWAAESKNKEIVPLILSFC